MVAGQVAALLLLIAVGYGVRKKNIVSATCSADLSKVLFYVISPALNFNTFSKEFSLQDFEMHYKTLLSGLSVVIVLIIFGKLLSKLLSKDKYERGIFAYSFIVANYGYVGYPLMAALYGEEMLLKMMIFTIPLTIYTYTDGYRMLTDSGKLSLKKLINPALISIGIGAVFGIFEIPVPSFCSSTIEKVANCLSPISMLMTGMVISEYKLSDVLLNRKVYIVAVVRLLLIPFMLIGVLLLLHVDTNVILLSAMTFSMSCGLNTIVFPKLIGKDCRLGVGFAVVSTVLSVITIPIVLHVIAGL